MGDAQLSLSMFQESIDSFESALKLDPENEEIKKILAEVQDILKKDQVVPAENPMRQSITTMVKGLNENGGELSKCRVNFFSENSYGVTAESNINSGEDLLFIPIKNILTG